jgi:hypothetical protein
MEVGLVAAAVVGAWAAWAEGRELPAWGAAAALVLLRIDGAALALLLLAAWPAMHRRMPWRGLALFAALVLPWAIYALATFGSVIPQSLHAKLVVYGRLSRGALPNLKPFVADMTHNPFGAAMAIGAALSVVLALRMARTDRNSRMLLWPCAWLLVYYGGIALSRVFLFGWYFVAPTPIYYLAACAGWSMALRGRFPASISSQAKAAMACVAAVTLAAMVTPRVARTLHRSQHEEETLRIPIGLWLRQHSRPFDVVMLEPIGYVGYYSGLPVLDTVGLVSPEALPFYEARYPSPYHAMWTRLRPHWVLLRAGEWKALSRYESGLPASQRLEASYSLAHFWLQNGPPATALFLLFELRPAPTSPQPLS